MNQVELQELLTEVDNAGVFFVTASDLRVFELAAKHNDAYFVAINMATQENKAQLIATLGQALKFPQEFGQNWDALSDFICDLSWIRSDAFVLCLANSGHFRDRHEEDFLTLVAILEEASIEWRDQGVAFWVLLGLPDHEFDKMADD